MRFLFLLAVATVIGFATAVPQPVADKAQDQAHALDGRGPQVTAPGWREVEQRATQVTAPGWRELEQRAPQNTPPNWRKAEQRASLTALSW
jgi:hypothetical protein